MAKSMTMDKTEVRSDFVPPANGQLSSGEAPCSAPPGYFWVHAYPRLLEETDLDPNKIGKWLVRMNCPYVEDYWGMIRDATEEGSLGIGSKISTDWGMRQDPSGSWRNHVVCVYTADWTQQEDVLRVAQRLHAIGAVKKMILLYKPDLFTRNGLYEGNASGRVTIYKCRAPYTKLEPDHRQLSVAESLLNGG